MAQTEGINRLGQFKVASRCVVQAVPLETILQVLTSTSVCNHSLSKLFGVC